MHSFSFQGFLPSKDLVSLVSSSLARSLGQKAATAATFCLLARSLGLQEKFSGQRKLSLG